MWAPSSRERTAAATAAITLCWATLASAGPEARVRVRGASQIEATATVTTQATELAGRVSDDAGRPISGARVRVRWATETTRPPSRPLRCDAPTSARGYARPSGDEDATDADENGLFCLRWPLEIQEGQLRLDFDDPTKLLDSSSVTVELERRAPFELLFAPPPRALSADDPSVTVVVQARAQDDSATQRVAVTLAWAHVGKPPTDVARGELRMNEALRFSFSPNVLGAPGSGELSASAHADGREIRARALVAVTARVRLAVATRAQANAEGEALLDVEVGSAFGPVPSGSIEALAGGRTIGIALVADGRAEVPLTLPAVAGEVPVSIRYLSAAPWWLPSGAETVRVEVPRPAAWRWLPWAAALLIIAAWLLPAWRRPVRREVESARTAPALARPDLSWVAPASSSDGWSGTVLDAHDQGVVPHARIVIARPDGSVFETSADAEGSFLIAPEEARGQGAQIRVEATYHAALERQLPPPGRLTVSLLTRRRALLARLVEWAERRSAPSAKSKEPTPAELALAAEHAGQAEVRAWAVAVEATAFGPSPVDAVREAEVSAAEPSQPVES